MNRPADEDFDEEAGDVICHDHTDKDVDSDKGSPVDRSKDSDDDNKQGQFDGHGHRGVEDRSGIARLSSNR